MSSEDRARCKKLTVGPLIYEKRGTNYNVCYQQVVALLWLPMLFLNCCNHSNHIIACWNNTADAHFIYYILYIIIYYIYILYIFIHFRLTHWRIVMPCRRQLFTQLLTISYVTLIGIHFGWIRYLSNSFYPTRI